MLKLREIHIKNFKSLRDCKLELRNFNVLVGANASGKTNLVDLFLLLRKIYVEKDINPFRYWWGYQNAVWNRKEELDISVKFLFDYIDGDKTYKVSFETTFTGRGGRFEILREKLEIEGLISLEFEGNSLAIIHAQEYLSDLKKTIESLKEKPMFLPMHWKIKFKKLSVDNIINEIKEQNILIHLRNIFDIKERIIRFPSIFRRGIIVISTESSSEDEMHHAIIFSPIIKTKELTPFGKAYIVRPLLVVVLDSILDLFSKTLILKLNINEIKRPSPLRKEDWILEDGSNLNSVLYNFYLKENRIPDRIATIISYLFPNINLRFSLTEDQRVYLKVQEDSLELPPVCIADGLYKLLAILSALELKPSLLIIDEIENSLHPKTLEMLLDELKSSDTTVIVTTHSPVVVDMIEPEDLVIVEKIAGETKFRRIKNPEEIKKKLKEAGITFSEGWLYGEI